MIGRTVPQCVEPIRTGVSPGVVCMSSLAWTEDDQGAGNAKNERYHGSRSAKSAMKLSRPGSAGEERWMKMGQIANPGLYTVDTTPIRLN